MSTQTDETADTTPDDPSASVVGFVKVLAPQLLDQVAKYTHSQDTWRQIARHPAVSTNTLKWLMERRCMPVLWDIAELPSTTADMLAFMAECAQPTEDHEHAISDTNALSKRIAQHPAATTETLDKLSKWASGSCAKLIAAHANVSNETVRYLLSTCQSDHALYTIGHDTKDTEALDYLAQHISPDARLAAASNPHTPAETLLMLAISGTPPRSRGAWEPPTSDGNIALTATENLRKKHDRSNGQL